MQLTYNKVRDIACESLIPHISFSRRTSGLPVKSVPATPDDAPLSPKAVISMGT